MKFTINPNKKKPNDSSPFNQSCKPQNKTTKPKNEQQHLADVYASFVKSFDGPSLDTSNFVHGGSLDPNNNKQTPAKEPASYHSSATPTTAAIIGSRKLTARDLARLKKEQQKSTALRKKKGGTRQIHLLFEEMKARQQRDVLIDDHCEKQREDDGLMHGNTNNNTMNTMTGNTDYNASTNLYVGNLPLNICETELMEIFGKYGIIASVKIMWPRTEQEHARDRLCGFVSYIRRCDAEMALNELKDVHLFGERLRLGWGKPVVGTKEDSLTIEQQTPKQDINIMEYQVPPTAVRYVIRKPDNKTTKQIIDRTAFYVAQFGESFESAIIEKELKTKKNTQQFSFLVDSSDFNKYYRWRVYSISMGDSLYKWRVSPFQMVQNGAYWIPPMAEALDHDMLLLKSKKRRNNNNNNNSTHQNINETMHQMNMSNKDRRRLTSRPLSDRDRTSFMSQLRQLNCKRFKIKEAMIFCLDHSEFGKEVCEILSEALTLNETVFNKKLARLFLVSDVLCNCNTAKIKNASLYRSEFKNKHLVKIFKSLHHLLVNAVNGTEKKNIKEQVLKVIKVWDNQCVFPSFFTKQLKQIFVYGEKLDKNVILQKTNANNSTSEKDTAMKKLREKNLVYPPHSKLFIAKKANNPNKAFTAYSFAKLKSNSNDDHDGNADDDNTNHFTKMIKNDKKKEINNVQPGKYDGEPLPLDQCVDIRFL